MAGKILIFLARILFCRIVSLRDLFYGALDLIFVGFLFPLRTSLSRFGDYIREISMITPVLCEEDTGCVLCRMCSALPRSKEKNQPSGSSVRQGEIY